MTDIDSGVSLSVDQMSGVVKNTTELFNSGNNEEDDIKIQVFFNGLIMIIYLKDNLKLDDSSLRIESFLDLIRQMCMFDVKQEFTLKWIDEEGDPCTISTQIELDEAIRLYYLNKESDISLHVFANKPEKPGYQCVGEDRSLYRRGARRWRKIYLVNGHKYQAKRFARTASCRVCHDKIWGLGRQGYKCLDCKMMVHKRCHRFISLQCDDVILEEYLKLNPHLKYDKKIATVAKKSIKYDSPSLLGNKKMLAGICRFFNVNNLKFFQVSKQRITMNSK